MAEVMAPFLDVTDHRGFGLIHIKMVLILIYFSSKISLLKLSSKNKYQYPLKMPNS